MVAVELPPTLGGRYRPIKVLGRGGMGVVYEVEHLRTGQRLALKVLDKVRANSPRMLDRFQREARAPARIKSEHVVTVTDADIAPELDDAPYVVMELLVGEDLDARARRGRPLPEQVVGWLRQIAGTLDKAHRLGIVHRDLKPANLFVTTREDGSELVKLLDFGIAKMGDSSSNATSADEVVGTPTYMSPEQASGAAVSGAADRYALGLIAYRLLCGVVYWRGFGFAQLVNEILYAPLKPPSERESTFGPAFDEWFARATARDPAARFESAAEQIESLARALGLEALPIPTADPVTPIGAEPGAPSAPESIDSAPRVAEGETVSYVALTPRGMSRPARRPGGLDRRRALALAMVGGLAIALVVAAFAFRPRGTSLTPSASKSEATPAVSAQPPSVPTASAVPPAPPPAVTATASALDAAPPRPRVSPITAPRASAPQRWPRDPFADQK